MRELIQLDEQEWFDTFKPIPNHIDPNPSFQTEDGVGYMFETYGDELAFIRNQYPTKIWTYGDSGDGGLYIWNGFSVVNRIGYFVTTVPFDESKDYQITIQDGDEEEE